MQRARILFRSATNFTYYSFLRDKFVAICMFEHGSLSSYAESPYFQNGGRSNCRDQINLLFFILLSTSVRWNDVISKLTVIWLWQARHRFLRVYSIVVQMVFSVGGDSFPEQQNLLKHTLSSSVIIRVIARDRALSVSIIMLVFCISLQTSLHCIVGVGI